MHLNDGVLTDPISEFSRFPYDDLGESSIQLPLAPCILTMLPWIFRRNLYSHKGGPDPHGTSIYYSRLHTAPKLGLIDSMDFHTVIFS